MSMKRAFLSFFDKKEVSVRENERLFTKNMCYMVSYCINQRITEFRKNRREQDPLSEIQLGGFVWQ